MYPIITLLIVSSIGISLFALITYKMRESSNLRLRKSIILIGMVTSIITPILGLLLPEICEMLSPNVGRLSKETLSFALEPIVITPTGNVESSMLRLPSLVEVITAIWGIGLILASLSLFAHLISLRSVLHGAKLVEWYNGIEVYRLREGGVAEPFSVFGKIYLPFDEPAGQAREHILRHEAAHIQDGHGSERFLMLFFTRLYWFLPQAYYMQEELKDTHEYIADRLTIQEQGFDIKAYQYHLLNTLISGSNLNIVHAFNSDKQQLKKRIIMMNKQKTTRAYRWVWLLALPIVATMLWATNALTAQETKDKAEALKSKSHEITIPNGKGQPTKLTLMEGEDNSTTIYIDNRNGTAEKSAMPVLTLGGDKPRRKTFSVTDKEGRVENITVIEKEDKGSRWIRVDYSYNSDLQKSQQKGKKQAKNKDEYDTLTKFDPQKMELPSFPGGQAEMMKYLATNIKYPEQAAKKGKQGRVIVQFVVDTLGNISRTKILRSANKDLDQEALRVVKAMPKWEPAYNIDTKKKVKVSYALPVVFRLQ